MANEDQDMQGNSKESNLLEVRIQAGEIAGKDQGRETL